MNNDYGLGLTSASSYAAKPNRTKAQQSQASRFGDRHVKHDARDASIVESTKASDLHGEFVTSSPILQQEAIDVWASIDIHEVVEPHIDFASKLIVASEFQSPVGIVSAVGVVQHNMKPEVLGRTGSQVHALEDID